MKTSNAVKKLQKDGWSIEYLTSNYLRAIKGINVIDFQQSKEKTTHFFSYGTNNMPEDTYTHYTSLKAAMAV